jgi:hypothetical protein
MSRLLWDQVGERFYEVGIDHGVLYLSDGTAVPWNGLVSVEEDFGDETTTPYYQDGVKYLESQSVGDFSAKLSALTYPDEFAEYEGYSEIQTGLSVDGQVPKMFSLSYRTSIGNDVNGIALGYKLHVVYNLTAVLDDTAYVTLDDNPEAMQLSWKIFGTPPDLSGFRPSVHIIIDSRYVDPLVLSYYEELLYGSSVVDPQLPPMADLVDFAVNYHMIRIIDNGDGTWTAISLYDYITMLDPDTFQITQVDATFLDADTYTITSTDTPQGA